ncbi:MAG TPA: hypothetical protein RMH26_10000, partial [Polyangiaceae bacterium LLY-WYZ-15_(1-7)]|nr:hypothetical protein [Polyangiaceae bacterium LLY-WYZ-15_(1-7)]
VGIITVGTLGLVSLQQAATRGNMESRQMTHATQRTRAWIERLERDALNWNVQGAPATTRINTNYIQTVDNVWRTPPAVVLGQNAGADFSGRDLLAGDATLPTYCTQVRLRWAVQGQLIRADVRTFYMRSAWENDDSQYNLMNGCSAGAEPAVTAALSTTNTDLRAVYATTLLRWSPLQ